MEERLQLVNTTMEVQRTNQTDLHRDGEDPNGYPASREGPDSEVRNVDSTASAAPQSEMAPTTSIAQIFSAQSMDDLVHTPEPEPSCSCEQHNLVYFVREDDGLIKMYHIHEDFDPWEHFMLPSARVQNCQKAINFYGDNDEWYKAIESAALEVAPTIQGDDDELTSFVKRDPDVNNVRAYAAWVRKTQTKNALLNHYREEGHGITLQNQATEALVGIDLFNAKMEPELTNFPQVLRYKMAYMYTALEVYATQLDEARDMEFDFGSQLHNNSRMISSAPTEVFNRAVNSVHSKTDFTQEFLNETLEWINNGKYEPERAIEMNNKVVYNVSFVREVLAARLRHRILLMRLGRLTNRPWLCRLFATLPSTRMMTKLLQSEEYQNNAFATEPLHRYTSSEIEVIVGKEKEMIQKSLADFVVTGDMHDFATRMTHVVTGLGGIGFGDHYDHGVFWKLTTLDGYDKLYFQRLTTEDVNSPLGDWPPNMTNAILQLRSMIRRQEFEQLEPQSWFGTPKLDGFLDNAAKTLPHLDETLLRTGATMDSFRHLADSLKNKTERTFEQVESKMSEVLEWLTHTVPMDALTVVLQCVCLLFRVYQCYSDPNPMNLTVTLIELLILLQVPKHLYSQCMLWVINASKLSSASTEETEPQSETSLMSMIFALIGLIFCTGIPAPGVLKRATGYAGSLLVFTKVADSCKAPFVELVSRLPNIMRSWFLAVCPAGVIQEALCSGAYQKWCKQIEACSLLAFKEKLNVCEAHRLLVDELYQQGLVYHQALVDGNLEPKGAFAHVAKMVERSRELKGLRDTVENQANYRPAPFYVYLTGTPGVGKSAVSRRFSEVLAPTEWDRSRLLYSRNVASDYWDGYWGGYFGVVYGDFGQDTEGKSNLEAIFANSNEPYLLNMADLKDGAAGAAKGCPFSARLFIACSNAAFPSSNAVMSHHAEWRRRHALWNIRVKPEFANEKGEIDLDKTPDDVKRMHGHLEWQLLHPTEPGKVLSPIMDTISAMRLTRELYNKHVTNQTLLLDAYQSDEFLKAVNATEPQSFDADETKRKFAEVLNPQDREEFLKWSNNTYRPMSVKIRDVYPGGAMWDDFKESVSNFSKKLIPKSMIEAETEVEPDMEKQVTEVIQKKMLGSSIASWFWKHFKAIAAAVAMLAAVFGGVLAYKSINTDPEEQGSSMVSGSDVARRHTVVKTVGAKPQVQRGLVAQDMCSNMEYDAIRAKIRANQVIMTYDREGVESHIGNGLAIGGHVILTNYHSLLNAEGTLLPDGSKITVYFMQGEEKKTFDFKLNHKDCATLQTDGVVRDVVFIRYPVEKRNFRDLRKYFLSADDFAGLKPGPISLLVWNWAKAVEMVAPTFNTIKHVHSYTKGDVLFDHKEGIEYNIPVERGFCGSPVVLTAGARPGRILGIHRAGKAAGYISSPYGHAEIIYRETLDTIWKDLENVDTEPPLPPGSVEAQAGDFDKELFQMPHIELKGRLPDHQSLKIPGRTNIRESPIHDMIREHVKEPAVLHPSDPRLIVPGSVIERSLAKNGNAWFFDDTEDMEDIFEDIRAELNFNSKEGCVNRVLTLNEAINGINGVDFIDGLEMTSSAGYPYKYTDPGKGKSHLFEQFPDGHYEVKSENLQYNLDAEWSAWQRGERYPEVFVDCLKDELRPMDKIPTGKTRTINVASLHFLINFRRLFLGYQAYLMKNRHTTSVALGTNPFAEWDSMVQYLRKAGNNFIAGDYSHFDGDMMAQMARRYADLASDWYNDGPELRGMRRIVMYTVMITLHAYGPFLYVTDHSNPSGFPATTHYNIVFNMYLVRKAFLLLAPSEFRSMMSFRRHTRAKMLGDDNTLCVSNDVYGWFNLRTISHALKGLGITYGPPDKTLNVDIGPELENWTFLKFGFRYDPAIMPGVVLPTMDKTTIFDLTNWIRDGPDHWAACEANCVDALNFAFFHGREFFNTLRDSILEAFREAHAPSSPVLPTFGDLRRRFLDGNFQQWLEPQSSDGAVDKVPSRSTPVNDTTTKSDDAKDMNTTATQKTASKDSLGVQSSYQTTVDVQSRTAKDKLKGLQKAFSDYLPDLKWTLDDTAKKEAYLATVQWTAGTPALGSIWSANVPLDILPDPTQSLGWNAFAYAHPALKLTFRLQSNKFCGGVVKIAYFVGMRKEDLTWRHHHACYSMPGSYMSACVSGTSSLIIPYTSPLGWIRTKGAVQHEDNIGAVVIYVISPLVQPTSSSSVVQLLLTSEFVETNFRVLDPSDLPGGVITEPQGFLDLIPGIGPIIGAATGVMKSIGDVESVVGNLDKPTIDHNEAPLTLKPPRMNTVEGLEFSQKLSLRGRFQRIPTAGTFGTSLNECTVSNVATRWSRLDNFSWSTTTPSGTFLAAYPVCPLPWAMPTVLANLGSEGIHTVAGHLPTPWSAGPPVVKPIAFDISCLDFASLGFIYWSGSIRYRIIIASSSFHTGQMIVTYYPGHSSMPAATDNQRTARWFKIFELSAATQEFEIEIPFVSQSPVKMIPNGWLTDNAVGGETYAKTSSAYCCGIIGVSVYTGLQAPPAAFNAVDVIVMVAAGSDYRVMTPHAWNRSVFPMKDDDSMIEAQSETGDVGSSASGSEQAATEMKNLKGPVRADGVLTLAPLHTSYDGTKHFGDGVDDYTELFRRWQLLENFSATFDTTNSCFQHVLDPSRIFDIILNDGIGTLPAGQRQTLFALYGSAFRFWFGAIRFRVYIQLGSAVASGAVALETNSLEAMAVWCPTTIYENLNTSFGIDVTGGSSTSINGTSFNVLGVARDVGLSPGMLYLDFEVPFYTLFEMCYNPATIEKTETIGTQNPCCTPWFLSLIVRIPTPSSATVVRECTMDVYVAASDEFSMGGFIGPPLVAITALNLPDGYGHPPPVMQKQKAKRGAIASRRSNPAPTRENRPKGWTFLS